MAFSALTRKSHVPRWASATEGPAGAAVKSDASQPEFDDDGVGPGGTRMSFVGTRVPVTSPEPENVIDAVSKSAGVGDTSESVGSARFRKNGNVNSCSVT